MDSKIDDGGPAHPVFPNTSQSHGAAHLGMSLRDHFAGQAMLAILSTPRKVLSSGADAADIAYEIADAMLKARRPA